MTNTLESAIMNHALIYFIIYVHSIADFLFVVRFLVGMNILRHIYWAIIILTLDINGLMT